MLRNQGYSVAMSSRDLASVQSCNYYGQSASVPYPPMHLGVKDTHPVFIILVQIQAALLRLPPSLGHSFINIGLVNDLGYALRSVIDSWRIRGGDLCTVNGVGGAILDEKGQESEDRTNEKDDN